MTSFPIYEPIILPTTYIVKWSDEKGTSEFLGSFLMNKALPLSKSFIIKNTNKKAITLSIYEEIHLRDNTRNKKDIELLTSLTLSSKLIGLPNDSIDVLMSIESNGIMKITINNSTFYVEVDLTNTKVSKLPKLEIR